MWEEGGGGGEERERPILEAAKSTHCGNIAWEQEAFFEIVPPIRHHYPLLPEPVSSVPAYLLPR